MPHRGHITEVGYSAMEIDPGSAIAYEGTDDENSAPDAWGMGPPGAPTLNGAGYPGGLPTQAELGPVDDLVTKFESAASMVSPADMPGHAIGPTEPCGLTMAEFEAHKAQMVADAEHANKQKMIHMAMAAGGGFLLCKLMGTS